ncbi:MAG: hypothetical protein HYR93_02275 [Chloroflexi bacterium]|nr:hypothetical protein [Chloroflexota bacterium]
MIAVEVMTSVFCVTLRTSTEYNAQVNAAAIRLMFPQNSAGDSSALRGSITAITPSVEIINATMRRAVVFSPSKKGAKSKMKAGVAEVTSEPLDAVESFVPTNWNPSETPYPTTPTKKICQI